MVKKRTSEREYHRPRETSAQARDDRYIVSEAFEESTTRTLEAQDRLLVRMEKRLDSKVLNGGFDDLMTKVNKIESVQEQLNSTQVKMGEKLDAIHDGIYDPEKGLYSKVKQNAEWIDAASKAFKWVIALMVTGLMAGAGKLLYDFITKHFHS